MAIIERVTKVVAAVAVVLLLVIFTYGVGFFPIEDSKKSSIVQRNLHGSSVTGVSKRIASINSGSTSKNVQPSKIVHMDSRPSNVQISNSVNGSQVNSVKKKTGKIKVTQDTLDRIVGGVESVVAVPLFDGEVVQVQLEERVPNGSQGMLVYGKVKDDPDSRVYFSIVKHAMFASLRLADGRGFKIESLPQGKHDYELIEVNTVAAIRHQKRPGIPEPELYQMVNGKKHQLMRCYAVNLPKSQMPLRKMLETEAWNLEMKVVAFEPDQDGLSGRINLRQPYQRNNQPPGKDQAPEKANQTLARRVIGSSRQVQYAALNSGGGGWVINKYGQWMKKPAVGGYGGGGGGGGGTTVSIGFIYTPRAETLLGDVSKVQAKIGTFLAGMNQANKDSGIQVYIGQAGNAFKISKDFDGKNSANMTDCLRWMSGTGSHAGNTIVTDWRTQNKADLVSCIVEGDPSGNGAVGLGVKLSKIGGDKDAFYHCLWHSTNDITFSHEAGHNLGLGHDPTAGGPGILPNSWGNHFTAGGKGYITIMAYQKPGFMTEANIWSSPNVKYQGTTTGSAACDSVGTLKQTYIPVSKYY